MAIFTWTTNTSADWSTAGDWTPSGPPGPGDTAVFGAATSGAKTSYAVTVNGTYTVSEVDLAHSTTYGGATLSIAGSLTVGTLVYDSGNHGVNAIKVTAGGLLDIGSITDSSGIAETINIAGTGAGGHLDLDTTTVDPDITFNFNNKASGLSTGVLEYTGGYTAGLTSSQAITNFGLGDQLIFDDGANFSGDTATYSGTTLTIKSGTNTVLTLTNLSESAGVTGYTLSGGSIMAVCYAAGTHILTPGSERRVENLREGDLVVTVVGDQGVVQRVRWVGKRHIDLTAHPRPETVAPVRIRRGAFAEDVPHRDLRLSPDHAVLVDGYLVCARQLINGATIQQELTCPRVTYFHVELDAHGILLAEGLTAESYLNTGNRGFFANSGEPLTLHPDLTNDGDYPLREAASVAPFVWDEERVRPIWMRLADRARALGRALPTAEGTADPDVRVLVKGRPLKPLLRENGLFIFVLPNRTQAVELVSNANSPTDTRPWLEDRRVLGLYVESITVRGMQDVWDIPLDHVDLCQGWWAAERDGMSMRRWTNGSAVLPLPEIEGSFMLEIRASNGGMTYVPKTGIPETSTPNTRIDNVGAIKKAA